MANVYGIIPARYSSTRFPGKPLVDINGKSMVQRVYEQASLCKKLDVVIVATDDERIFDHVKSFGGRVVMTSPDHISGTSRLGEVIQIIEGIHLQNDIVVNIQGDEPFIRPLQIDLVLKAFSNPEVQIGTLISKIVNPDDLFNPNVVKVIVDKAGKALFFSRSAIPFVRGRNNNDWLEIGSFYRHIGLYAYKANVLSKLVELPEAEIEKMESLEQLRWLYNGYSIYTSESDIETIGIDTPEDLLKLTNKI